jgi:hypothetical protein
MDKYQKMLFQTLRRKTHYTNETYTDYFYDELHIPPRNHPLKCVQNADVDELRLVGSICHSASIGAFIYRVSGSLDGWDAYPSPNRFIVHFCPNPENVSQRNIYIEAITPDGISTFCGGMTDYSGEGGRAYRECRGMIEVLAKMQGVEVIEIEHTPGTDEKVQEIVHQYYQQQFAGG